MTPAQRSDVFDLQTLLSPIAAEEFLRRDYGRHFVRVSGYPGKFSALLPWPALNQILEEHRMEPPRLRLTREGKPVPADRWISSQPNRKKKRFGHTTAEFDGADPRVAGRRHPRAR